MSFASGTKEYPRAVSGERAGRPPAGRSPGGAVCASFDETRIALAMRDDGSGAVRELAKTPCFPAFDATRVA
jgi:hypothetical protein